MKVLIIIPAFNESQIIGHVLENLPTKLGAINFDHLVVDDGSSDRTHEVVTGKNVIYLRHTINRGAGAATKTGLEYAKKNAYDVVITFDADGQHDPADIEKVLTPILKNRADFVIGSRLKNKQKMPLDRLILNKLANLSTLVLFGVYSSDSQSGLKALSKKAVNLIDFKADRMEFASEMLLEAKKNKLRMEEVPIKAIYTQYSLEKGQKNTNAIPILIRTITKLLR